MTTGTSLQQALNDVRKAYRLIWLYQTRVRDVVRVIRDEFDHEFHVWDTSQIGKPCRRTADPIDEGTWSMLPFYRICLLHLPPDANPNRPTAGEWMLEIDVEADDGFPKGENEDYSDSDPTKFVSTDKCGTKLHLHAWYCTKTTSLSWYAGIWDELPWPSEEGVPVKHTSPPVTVISKVFDLAALSDKNSIINAVDRFKEMLTSKIGVEFPAGATSHRPSSSRK